MKVPLGWLKDYVDLTLPVAELARRLTLAGLEVSGVRLLGVPAPEGLRIKDEDAGPVWQPDKIVIGKVLSVERHPNADRLTLATVDYGAAQPRTVVTGAPNIKVGESGQKVIVALTGAVLFDGHAEVKALKELKPSKIRGVASDAMVCSAYELGISNEHEGIILLEDEAPVGMPLADFMGDIVLELDVTPNLARCLSMIGVAREVAALTGQSVKLPAQECKAEGDSIEGLARVEIADPRLAARYAAALLKGMRRAPAPGWMQRRLTYAGMRPIDNIVDITNYVMLEWGQPLHAFDYDVLVQRAGGKAPLITVRPAHSGEKIKTLDGVERSLSADNLVIADVAGPIAIAGVMGGAETEVTARTTNILLESAHFDFRSIRRTMKALNLPSEASMRFSRDIHPALVRPALERAAELMRIHAGGIVCRGFLDAYPAPPAAQVIDLKMSEVRRLLGMDFPIAEAMRILRSLEFGVEEAGPDQLRVTAPPHRRDIQAGAPDLIEDLVRIHGYDRMPATLLADSLPQQHAHRDLDLEEQTRDILVGAGLQEAINYSMTTPEAEAPLGLVGRDYVRLQNPISSERTVMRQTVLAGVLEVTAANLRHTDDVRFFEVGPVFLVKPGEKLPDEPRRLAIAMCGRRRHESWAESGEGQGPALDFFDLKAIIEALVGDLHIAGVTYRPGSTAFLHPGKGAELVIDDKVVGMFGQMHPNVAERFEMAGRVVLAAELDLEALLAAVPERYNYVPVPRFPAALRDVAVIVPETIPSDRIQAEIRTAGGNLLAQARLFDLYRGPSVPPGTKSLAFALTYQAPDRTLTDKEVDKAHKKIEDRLKHVLKAQIRGKE